MFGVQDALGQGCGRIAGHDRHGLPGQDRALVHAFGDQMNDITMLAYAGLGIAMDNGKEEAKSQAKYVTAGNDEGGIAAALERFVL